MPDLLWETAPVATKPKNYRAPSWSWASLDRRIDWPLWQVFSSCGRCYIYCTVLDVQTTPVGLDPYGGVKDGFLNVREVFEKMTVVWVGGDKSQHPWRFYRQGKEIGNVNLDVESNVIQLHGRENIYQALLVAECNSCDESKTLIRGLLLEKNGRKRENHDDVERVGTSTLFSGVMPGLLGVWNSDAEDVILIV
jgi:hypothetical protein